MASSSISRRRQRQRFARQHYASSFSSSSSSSSSPHISSSSPIDDKEEHNRKVAAAQSLVFARLQRQQPQKHKQKQHNQRGEVVVESESSSSSSSSSSNPMSAIIPSPTITASTLSLEEKLNQRRSVLKSIQLWLSEDPSFFVATMEKLDLKVLQPPNKNNSNNKNNDSSVSIINDNNNSINHIHPIQSVWDQYRQLYYESIPDFVIERLSEKEISDDDNFKLLLQELISGGFGDPQWSRKFRQIRGYRLNQDQSTRQITNQQNELKRLQHDVIKEGSQLKFLEGKLSNLTSRKDINNRHTRRRKNRLRQENNNSLIDNEHDNRHTRRRKNRLRQENKIQNANSQKAS